MEEKTKGDFDFKKAKEFVLNKKVQWTFLVILLIILLIWSSSVRVSNLDLLKDQTTGKNIPLALDPYYFLRLAETIVKEGGLPAYDPMRISPIKNISFTDEILPQAIVFLYNAANIFGDYSLQYIDVISPVIFYILGLIFFFFFSYFLFRSKWAAFISAFFLATIPAYLYRTMAGFSDHEAIGMMAFFAALLILTITLDKVNKKESSAYIYSGLLGFLTVFVVVSWAGLARFVFMLIPSIFFVLWVLESKRPSKRKLKKILYMYFSWLISLLIFALVFGYGIFEFLNIFIFVFTGFFTAFAALFFLVDYFLVNKKEIIKGKDKYRVVISLGATIILGVILYQVFIGNLTKIISDIFARIVNPFGTERVSLTVAENRQPYTSELISQLGKSFFWIFFVGISLIGTQIARGINQRKHQIIFSFAWIYLIAGILLSRFSESSAFNGSNFISKAFYFSAILVFVIYSIWLYFNKELDINSRNIVLGMLMIIMAISLRGAVRLFFVVVPFICLMAGNTFLIWGKQITKEGDDTKRLVLLILGIVLVILSIMTISGYSKSIVQQAQFTGPSANSQWQNAMSWIRGNTTQGSIFAHWWDYGYWIQTLGERPTIADGGHFESSYGDHLIGRYVLTTPDPNTAKSFLKTNDVSYLLIDQSDIGKYPAYSKIGSDEEGNDRYSWIQTMINDPRQTQETKEGSLRVYSVYSGGIPLDEDMIYEENGSKIFLPSGKAGIGALLLEIVNAENDSSRFYFKQPLGIFVYNGVQYRIPIRYIEYEGTFTDFKTGVGATIKFIPSIQNNQNGLQVDSIGAGMYLSPKVSKSLFAQLYLMDDPQNLYPTFALAHSEPDPFVANLNAQGAGLKEFVYYQGVRGPIKIWETEYPDNIIEREEFLKRSGEYGDLDNLTIVK